MNIVSIEINHPEQNGVNGVGPFPPGGKGPTPIDFPILQGNASKEIVAHERLYQELRECRLNQLKVAGSNLTAYTLTDDKR